MSTRRNPIAAVVAAVVVCAGVTVVGPPAQAQRLDPTVVPFNQFDEIDYVVAHRKAQMAYDWVAHAADRVAQTTAGPSA